MHKLNIAKFSYSMQPTEASNYSIPHALNAAENIIEMMEVIF